MGSTCAAGANSGQKKKPWTRKLKSMPAPAPRPPTPPLPLTSGEALPWFSLVGQKEMINCRAFLIGCGVCEKVFCNYTLLKTGVGGGFLCGFFFFLFLFFCFLFWLFAFSRAASHGIWKFPGSGSNQSCSHRPRPEPQQWEIRATSATYTTAHGNARSPPH